MVKPAARPTLNECVVKQVRTPSPFTVPTTSARLPGSKATARRANSDVSENGRSTKVATAPESSPSARLHCLADIGVAGGMGRLFPTPAFGPVWSSNTDSGLFLQRHAGIFSELLLPGDRKTRETGKSGGRKNIPPTGGGVKKNAPAARDRGGGGNGLGGYTSGRG